MTRPLPLVPTPVKMNMGRSSWNCLSEMTSPTTAGDTQLSGCGMPAGTRSAGVEGSNPSRSTTDPLSTDRLNSLPQEPALAAAMWAIHDAGAQPRPGVKPWRYLPCGCRTDGVMCVQHDPKLAEFWRRNSPGGAFDQAEAAIDRQCAEQLAEMKAELDAEMARPVLQAAE